MGGDNLGGGWSLAARVAVEHPYRPRRTVTFPSFRGGKSGQLLYGR